MIVSHRHRFIFIKTTKTAGTSVEMAISRYCGPEDIITEIEDEDERVRLDEGGKGPQNNLLPWRCFKKRDWRQLIRGTRPKIRSHTPAEVARKIVGDKVWESYFKFSIERDPYEKAVSRYFWGIKGMDPQPALSEFLQWIPDRKLSNWRIYAIDGRPSVDFMVRYESLAEDLEKVRTLIGLPEPLSLPNAKGNYRKDRRDYHDLLDEPSRLRVQQVCHKEIEEFNYLW